MRTSLKIILASTLLIVLLGSIVYMQMNDSNIELSFIKLS